MNILVLLLSGKEYPATLLIYFIKHDLRSLPRNLDSSVCYLPFFLIITTTIIDQTITKSLGLSLVEKDDRRFFNSVVDPYTEIENFLVVSFKSTQNRDSGI